MNLGVSTDPSVYVILRWALEGLLSSAGKISKYLAVDPLVICTVDKLNTTVKASVVSL